MFVHVTPIPTTILIGFFLLLAFLLSYFLSTPCAGSDAQKRALVIVLGDVGRSPRMQYHTRSLADLGFQVDLVGYSGTAPLEVIQTSPFIKLWIIDTTKKIPAGLSQVQYLVRAVTRVLGQFISILHLVLITIPQPDVVLIQNPPAIPTLLIAQIVRWVRQCRLVIDWHNFGYSIMELNLSNRSAPVVIAKRYEQFFGGWAEGHLCVSKAMSEVLKRHWQINGPISVLYDRSPESFKRLSLREIHTFLSTLTFGQQELTYTEQQPTSNSSTAITKTLLTELNPSTNEIKSLQQRPYLIVSSTSWTEDEDFGILLKAISIIESSANTVIAESRNSSSVGTGAGDCAFVFVITGKGPLKRWFEQEVRKMNLVKCRVLTAWLTMEDYPKLLGAADAGICFHTSSSGLDLPMKVVDMLGCGLPVMAVKYNCLEELLHHGENGLIFSTGDELADSLLDLLKEGASDRLGRLREGALKFQDTRWEENWNEVAKPFFA
ncbi:hypothetical protein HDU76_000899 [Blyttiomyces sp. JEL0837]|nr:hypothetical protein HDU76_000899 [Blyttiomyces sp. JEL0837]